MRRWLILAWLSLLLIPAAGLFGPLEPSSERESRMLAQPPMLPRTLAQWLQLPRDADAFIRDQFGLRAEMIRANTRIRRNLGETATAPSVVQGRDGFMLLREGLGMSLGSNVSADAAARTADLVCEMQQRLAQRGVRFVYAIAPATTTIYPEAAPDWMGAPRTPTNYDMLVRDARACGADTVDLRPALRAERATHLTHRRTDSHWTPRGAMAAYSAIARHLQRPDLEILPSLVSWRAQETDGDLLHLAGDEDTRWEIVDTPSFAGPAPREQRLPTPQAYANMHSYIRDYPREGASVLIIGDSYAHDFFPHYLGAVARRVSFIHHRACTFDWSDIARAEPEIVIFMPTERAALCPPNATPEHFN